MARHSFGSFTPTFLDELAGRLSGLRVLEVFAGNGLLAAGLAAQGVDVTATSLLSNHDGHHLGMHHPVVEMDALRAVRTLGGDADTLLMSWPTTTDAVAAAVLEWGDGRPVHWIGEITRPDLGKLGMGGCATDLFFAVTEVVEEIGGYEGRGWLDRAAVMAVRPECAARWRDGCHDRETIAGGSYEAFPEP